MAPRSPLCPVCGVRPRRMAGAKCLPCSVADTKARRAAARARREDRRKLPAVPLLRQRVAAKVLVITSAQNATPVHVQALAALQVYCKARKAQLLVVPLRYKNPTSLWNQNNERDDWWATEVKPYLCSARTRLHKHLVLAADVRTQPTASSPLSGFESLTGAESCIIGHPKMQFRAVSSPTGRLPKVLSTTGSITRPNSTDTKAGKLSEFHHFLGAVVVELDRGRFHLRQLNCDRATGAFTDLARVYSADGVTPAPPPVALVLGDTHARFADPAVDRATFGPGGIVEMLNPDAVVWNDLHDGDTHNPHTRADPFLAVDRQSAGKASVADEVRHSIAFAAMRSRGRRGYVVSSNHGAFLRRWLVSHDWRSDPENARFYLETSLALVTDPSRDPFAFHAGLQAPELHCLGADESLVLGGVECGMHGHQGPNGTRGSLKNLSRLGARVVTGHSHTPGIEEGHYQCGTSSLLRLDYNHGPSSWLHTHCVIYASGKRALLTVVDGHWRAP